MTIKRTAPPPSYGPAEQFPERPPRNDMQNSLFLNRPGHPIAVERHLGSLNTTLVISEMPIGWNLRQRRGLLYPDLLIAFNVDRDEAIARRGFAIGTQGKPPDFVLEIASLHTAENDYTNKRARYAVFGVPEYWRYDPTGSDYYPAPLEGDRLVDGKYQPIDISAVDDNSHRGHSEVLNLTLCWEHGQLRWWDPVEERYLRTHEDEAEERIATESRLSAAEAQRIAERQAAEARIRQLEEELRRRSP